MVFQSISRLLMLFADYVPTYVRGLSLGNSHCSPRGKHSHNRMEMHNIILIESMIKKGYRGLQSSRRLHFLESTSFDRERATKTPSLCRAIEETHNLPPNGDRIFVLRHKMVQNGSKWIAVSCSSRMNTVYLSTSRRSHLNASNMTTTRVHNMILLLTWPRCHSIQTFSPPGSTLGFTCIVLDRVNVP